MLKTYKSIVMAVLLGLMAVWSTPTYALDYLKGVPLTSVINDPVSACGEFRELPVPVIAWGPDGALSVANGNSVETAAGSFMANNGLNVRLYRQDDFQKQVRDFLACKTPFLRGTAGMVNQAAEVLTLDPRTLSLNRETAPVVIYQLSWSAGGDVLVVKEGINSPADLRGKTIALQYGGPHVDYLLTILADAGLKPTDVKIVWTKDLLQIGSGSVSPTMALRNDPTVDAVFVISPDALALTSNGTVGTGSEDSVKGARILLSTKTANRVIADVYAVRSDYFQAHRDQVEKFVNAVMRGEEKLAELIKSKGKELVPAASAAAALLLDSDTAGNDFVGLYGDAEVVGFAGNVKFFTDQANPRSFDKITGDVQRLLTQLGFLSRVVPVAQAHWNYAGLKAGLSNTGGVELTRFDQSVVQTIVDRRAKQSGDQGVLFKFEVYFGANQNGFSAEQYKDAFDRAIKLATTYGGALMTVEGHSDPLGYLRQKKAGDSPVVLGQVRQAAKNLSYSRANAVKDSIVAYASAQGITLDPSQFGIVGFGVSQPNTPNCSFDSSGDITLSCAPRTEQEWSVTRRVVFKIIQVEAEASVFKPL